MNARQAHNGGGVRTAAKQPDLSQVCAQCHVGPRLGVLSRCGNCIRATAEEDRQTRQAAESRLATRKSAKEAEARATAERHAALEKLGELYLQFVASPEGIRLAEAQQAELTAPRNDRAYLETLEDHEKDRTQVANVTATVHHTVDGGRSWLSIGLTNPGDHARAPEAARASSADISKRQSSGTKTRRTPVRPLSLTHPKRSRRLDLSALIAALKTARVQAACKLLDLLPSQLKGEA